LLGCVCKNFFIAILCLQNEGFLTQEFELKALKKYIETGLPDGIFSNQKIQFGQLLEGLGMENVATINNHLEYNMAIWHILRPFGNLEVIWCIFTLFGILCQVKSGNPE
jgi:hypothetical protein